MLIYINLFHLLFLISLYYKTSNQCLKLEFWNYLILENHKSSTNKVEISKLGQIIAKSKIWRKSRAKWKLKAGKVGQLCSSKKRKINWQENNLHSKISQTRIAGKLSGDAGWSEEINWIFEPRAVADFGEQYPKYDWWKK